MMVSATADYIVSLPKEYTLTNYPNPFNPETTIRYSIVENASVAITIHNALGQQLAVLTNKEHSAGTYEITWNAASLPSGIYLCCMQAGHIRKTTKLVIAK